MPIPSTIAPVNLHIRSDSSQPRNSKVFSFLRFHSKSATRTSVSKLTSGSRPPSFFLSPASNQKRSRIKTDSSRSTTKKSKSNHVSYRRTIVHHSQFLTFSDFLQPKALRLPLEGDSVPCASIKVLITVLKQDSSQSMGSSSKGKTTRNMVQPQQRSFEIEEKHVRKFDR